MSRNRLQLKLSDESRLATRKAIAAFFIDELDMECGELMVSRIFDFMIGAVGAIAYNQGVSDAQAYLQNKLLDMEIDLTKQIDPAGGEPSK